jgi:L-malate glycosyltransferase
VSPPVVHVASGREWRGGQRQVWLLARALAQRGVNQVVVTGGGTELAHRLGSAGIPLRPASWSAGLDPRVAWPVLRELRLGGAILHAHDAHALALAALCGALTGTPLIVTRRVTFPLRRPFLWQRAQCVIAISTAVRNALLADGLDPRRITVVPSGVDLDELSAVRQAGVRRHFGIPESGQVAVNLGSLTAEKDQSTLVSAAALLVRDLPALHWVVVGEGMMEAKLKRQIAEQGMEGRFHLMGPLADPHGVLSEADVFVLSSVSEGLGSSAIAAMALGIPVVATGVGGLPELLGSGRGMLVPPRDPAALAEAVHGVLTDAGLRGELTQRARQAAGEFSMSAMADRVLSVYRSCAHSLEGS